MQKTAYEVRISDWSSDVCSSDLLHASGGRELGQGFDRHGADGLCRSGLGHTAAGVGRLSSRPLENPRQTGLCDDARTRRPGTEWLARGTLNRLNLPRQDFGPLASRRRWDDGVATVKPPADHTTNR